jgi:hypothetical protein
MPAPKSARLFAYTYVEMKEIEIFLDDTLKGCWAVTWTDKPGKTKPYIIIHPKVLTKNKWFQEILVHEFVHVLEEMYSYILRKPNPKDCTQYAAVIGRYLPRMLRDFERV